MKFLPSRLQPWRTPFERRHAPKSRAYESFRQCLRWEFGFTCCICLCHESDFFAHGVEGTGLMHIEHRWLQSDSPTAANLYSNTLLVCRLCNLARGRKPLVSSEGARLLSPTEVSWAEHFELDGDRLVPRAGDPDGLYTYLVYDLDDPQETRHAGVSA